VAAHLLELAPPCFEGVATDRHRPCVLVRLEQLKSISTHKARLDPPQSGMPDACSRSKRPGLGAADTRGVCVRGHATAMGGRVWADAYDVVVAGGSGCARVICSEAARVRAFGVGAGGGGCVCVGVARGRVKGACKHSAGLKILRKRSMRNSE
jgi:hypothetical protein